MERLTATPPRLVLALALALALVILPLARAQFPGTPISDVPPSRNTMDGTCTALRSFREYLLPSNPSSPVLPSWTPGEDCCNSWEGVECESGEVKRLELPSKSLNGTIPSLSNLTTLTHLNLSGNNFTGGFPKGLHLLVGLQRLDLSSNILDVSIPSGLFENFSQLEVLNLEHNKLQITGGLEVALPSLKDLRVLDISHNNFSGSIPLQVFSSSSYKLTRLNLSSNAFDGTLAEAVGDLSNLTALDVSYNNLSGGIPSSLWKCTQLEFLLLQGNHFSGAIPQSLERLTELKLLDLSNNNLSRRVPTGGIFNDSTKFIFAGNDNLCGGHEALGLSPCNQSASTGKGGSRLPKVALAIIIAVATGFFLLLLLWVLCRYRYFRKGKSGGHFKHISFLKAPFRVTYADLHAATKGFSSANLFGLGSIGSVYKGFLEDERRAVAVKVFRNETIGDSNSFLEGCRVMKKITHSNLVKILATCTGKDPNGYLIMALVYELMPNGNLEMWLHREVPSQAVSFRKWNLSLFQRLNMAIDVASALVHLHLQLERPVVHCNLKPSNILISEDMTAHVTDFGMNRFFALDAVIANSNGYIAPECVMGGPISPLWDVYSFGILLLEMFTRKRPNGNFGDGLNLHKYVQKRFLLDLDCIVDPLLVSEETGGKLMERSRKCLNSIIMIALSCSNEYPAVRMEIRDALEKLEQVKLDFLEVGGNGGMPPHSYFGPSASANPMLT